MIVELKDICSLSFGPYLQASSEGTIPYLQIRQFNDEGQLVYDVTEFVSSEEKTRGYILKEGDVLFVGKGSRLFAWCYDAKIGPAIASSIFYVLRTDTTKINPDFLAAILNLQQSKNTFNQMSAGTNIFSIRKSELGAFKVPLLPIKEQFAIANLSKLHQQEITVANQLINQKQNLYSGIISKLIK
jgi:restriction endonuclease S subunit